MVADAPVAEERQIISCVTQLSKHYTGSNMWSSEVLEGVDKEGEE